MVVLIGGVKHACAQCLKGHRVSKCNHSNRELTEIQKKGRKNSLCPRCALARETNPKHVRCGHVDKDGNNFNSKITKKADRSITSSTPIASTSKLSIPAAPLSPSPAKITSPCFCGDSCSCSGCYLHDPQSLKPSQQRSNRIEENLHKRKDESAGAGCLCGTVECVGLDRGIEELLRKVSKIHQLEFQSGPEQVNSNYLEEANSLGFTLPVYDPSMTLAPSFEPVESFWSSEEQDLETLGGCCGGR